MQVEGAGVTWTQLVGQAAQEGHPAGFHTRVLNLMSRIPVANLPYTYGWPTIDPIGSRNPVGCSPYRV